ncbi:MAG TPA: hypothetical protein DCS97_13280 [Planctomycetes bacterium]|nr:hypothetical protein [Planctomycetota bacterium]
MTRFCILLCCALLAVAGEDLLPHSPAGPLSLHGTLAGERFWAKLGGPDPAYGGNRVLEVVYTPPKPETLGGAHLIDCPFLLLDDRLRLVAWNGRDTLARVVANATGYAVTREILRATEDAKDQVPAPVERQVAGARGWDERLAPLLLALTWQPGSRGEVPCHDLFATISTPSAVSWRDRQVVIAGRPYSATADAAGRLLRLDDAAGQPAISVTAWIATP